MNSDFLKFRLPFGNIIDGVNVISKDTHNGIFPAVDNEFSLQNWSNLPGSYGAFCGDPIQLDISAIRKPWPLIRTVLDVSNFKGTGDNSLKVSEHIINQPANNFNRHTLQSEKANQEFIQLYSIKYGTFIENVISGLLYTTHALMNGIPVILGVNCQPYPTTDVIDESTNNYIIIVGMGNNGRNYLLGWDIAYLLEIANNGGDGKDGISLANKIYLDPKWPGLLTADNPWPNIYASVRQPYKVTQVFKTFILQ